MALVDDNDVQVHLPVDKLIVEELPDSVQEVMLDLERVIKGTLSQTYSATTLASWSTPETTPEYIRAIGGRLAAALIYRLRLSQDYPNDSEYAIQKYEEAMMMLEQVRSGAVTLDVDEIIDSPSHLTTSNYIVGEDPKFTMDSVF